MLQPTVAFALCALPKQRCAAARKLHNTAWVHHMLFVCTECRSKPTFKNLARRPLAEFGAQSNVCNSHSRQVCQGRHTCSSWVASNGTPSQTWQSTLWQQQQRTAKGTKQHQIVAVRV